MAALLPWKEFPTRLSPKLGDGVLDRPWEQVGTVHSLRTTECHVIERSEGFLPVLCPARLVYFCHFWVTERLDLRHRVAFPRPHRYPLAPPGWVTRPPCHTESIFDTERILPKQGIDHTVRSSLCQGQMFILLKCIHSSLSIILDCCGLFQPNHTQWIIELGKSFLCMGHGQDFLLGLSALVDCPDAWSSELSIQKAPRRNKNSWLLSVGPSDSPNHTVPIQWRKVLSRFFTKISLQ